MEPSCTFLLPSAPYHLLPTFYLFHLAASTEVQAFLFSLCQRCAASCLRERSLSSFLLCRRRHIRAAYQRAWKARGKNMHTGYFLRAYLFQLFSALCSFALKFLFLPPANNLTGLSFCKRIILAAALSITPSIPLHQLADQLSPPPPMPASLEGEREKRQRWCGMIPLSFSTLPIAYALSFFSFFAYKFLISSLVNISS